MQSQPQYPPPPMSNGAPMPQQLQHLPQHPQHHQHPQHRQHQQHPHHHPPPPSAYQYPPPAVSATPMPPSANEQNGAMMRYPIPPQGPTDVRAMSGGRHKKEIKRRTKTGCLTCRKRRIKCDEGHPACRNCAKSKRACLGYDPIFKQQPGPANIQPAPLGGNPPPPQQLSATGNEGLPHNHFPSPQTYPATGGAFAPASASHGEQHYGEYNNSASLDPALAGGDPSAHMAHNNYPALQPQRRVKQVLVEELFALNDISPRYNHREAPPTITPADQSEVESFYKYHYAIGLDRLFETTWYSSRGMTHLQHDPYLVDFVLQCAEQFKAKKSEEPSGKALLSLEARLVWLLAVMPRAAASSANGAGSDYLVQELLPRVDTIENLITGQFLDPSRAPPPPQQSTQQGSNYDPSTADPKDNELTFWHHLGRFVSIRDDNLAALKEVSDVLQLLRGSLGMLENRDVLYSIAIARHIGGRMPDFHPHRHLVASTNDQNDDVNKLKVAHQFVEGEDQRGTTQVIQRICSMAIRGWILAKQ